ncbi:MAG: SLC13 family permease [Acidobacteriota bacterium]
MTWEILFVLVLLCFAVASFLLERIPTDQTAILAFAAVVIGGSLPIEGNSLPGIQELLQVFASEAPVTIAAMFILSAALEKCGAIETLASALGRLAGLGYRRFLLVLMLTVAVVSAFINNTPVVMVFLPAVLTLSRTLKVPASKLLIPLSFASIMGGCCTLVGTSTNILASSVLSASGAEPLGMFEIAWVGVPLLLMGCLYLMVFAQRLLPDRETLTSMLSEEERKEFIVEAFVQKDSELAGRTASQSGLSRGGIRLLELIRDNVAIRVDPKATQLREGDRLVLGCRASGVAYARSIEGLALLSTSGVGLEAITAHEGSIVEGVIGPKSTIVGQTVREINFRQRFRVILIALHRRGVNLRDKLDTVPLESGDLLLMMGTDRAIEQLRASDDVLLLDKPRIPSRSLRKKTPIVVGTTALVILAASLNLMPISAAAIAGVAVILATGCLTPKEGYASIEWSILMLIFGMLGLGLAMQSTGADALMARGLTAVADFDFIAAESRPYVVLAALYFATMLMTETLSNNATVVLMTPVALSLGETLGVDPRAFVIATCLASSASFSTPIGYQTNTYVYGVAGYRFTDFTRVGLPLNLLCLVLSLLVIPRIWQF